MRNIKNGAESYQDSFFLKDIESTEKIIKKFINFIYLILIFFNLFKFIRKNYSESLYKDTFL